MPILDGRRREMPRLDPKKVWRPTYRTTPQPVTGGHLAYVDVRERAPGAAVGYGIARGGPWALVGEHRVRARTPEAALRQALAAHLGGNHDQAS